MQSSDDQLTDQQLIDRIRQGDGVAFKALFRTYYEPLCGFVESRIGDPSAAEDLVQNIFLGVWRRREEVDPGTSVKAYLFGAARNESIDFRKRKKVRDDWKEEHQVDTQVDLDGAPGPARQLNGPVEEAERRQLQEELQNGVDALPERRREVYILSRRHGLTYEEIAEVMEISPKTVDNQMVEALKFLRKRMRSYISRPDY
jgi:RNA polymerase sigma-70 factor (ECF subfamily)